MGLQESFRLATILITMISESAFIVHETYRVPKEAREHKRDRQPIGRHEVG